MRVLSSAVRLWVPVLAALLAVGCSPYDPGLLGGTGGTGGGGTGGGGTGGGGTGGECVETGPEICNGEVDEDCDRSFNNGNAAVSCTEILNATPRCSSSGSCLIGTCNRGFANCDGQPDDGCEPCSECPMPQTHATCQNLDDDAGADDAGDEDAGMSAPDGAVVDAATDAGTDSGGTCAPTNGGTEICDGVDNDCDGTADQASTCPTMCTGHTLDGRVYVVCRNSTSWSGARTACRNTALNMDLVRVNDGAENTAVHGLVTAQLGAGATVWIGANDATMNQEGQWRWSEGGQIDGAQFWMGNASGSAVGGLYENWATGQPDDAGGQEDCAQMTAGGEWNDLPCGTGASQRYVCERP